MVVTSSSNAASFAMKAVGATLDEIDHVLLFGLHVHHDDARNAARPP